MSERKKKASHTPKTDFKKNPFRNGKPQGQIAREIFVKKKSGKTGRFKRFGQR